MSHTADEIIVQYRDNALDLTTIGGAIASKAFENTYNLTERSVMRAKNIAILGISAGDTVDGAVARLRQAG